MCLGALSHSALAQLPSGSSSLVEQPNLQPVYGGQPPKPGDAEFVIKLWQLQQQRWLTSRVGGNAILDKLGSGSMASWQFFNVTVAKYQPQDCFGGAFTQVWASRSSSVGAVQRYRAVWSHGQC